MPFKIKSEAHQICSYCVSGFNKRTGKREKKTQVTQMDGNNKKKQTINDIWMGKGAVGTCSKKEISCLCLLMLCFLDCSYSVFKRVKAN